MIEPALIRDLVTAAEEQGHAERHLDGGGSLRIDVDPSTGVTSTVERDADGRVVRRGLILPASPQPPEAYPTGLPFVPDTEAVVWMDTDGVVLAVWQATSKTEAEQNFERLERELTGAGWESTTTVSSPLHEERKLQRGDDGWTLTVFALTPAIFVSLARGGRA